jgi:hypothetical protein
VSEGVTEGETEDDAVDDVDALELTETEDETVVEADTDLLPDCVALREADGLTLPLDVTDPDRDDVMDAETDGESVIDKVLVAETLTEGVVDPEIRAQPCGPTQRVQLSPVLPGSCQMSK